MSATSSNKKPSQRNTKEMANVLIKTKQLYLNVKENEDALCNDENLDMQDKLEETDKLYSSLVLNKPSAEEFLTDSNLLLLQAKIVRQNTKAYKIYTQTFNPMTFSKHMRNYFGLGQYDASRKNSDHKALSTLWSRLGECSKEIMYTVPTFNYLYGTFDADPVEPVQKKKRKSYTREKLGDLVKPALVSINTVDNTQDVMLTDAQRLLSCFMRYLQKSEKLVESKHSEEWSKTAKQSALSLSMEEYNRLIKTFGFKKPVIPPRKED